MEVAKEVSGKLHARPLLLPGKEALASAGQEAMWIPGSVGILWCTEKFLASAGNRIPSVQLVARRYSGSYNWYNSKDTKIILV
jgi:hypothetical protein